MKNDYSRNAILACPTCASEELTRIDAIEDENSIYRCRSCTGKYSYDEIELANSEKIRSAVAEIKGEVLDEIKTDFSKMFKKFGR